jgi:glucosylceramidase
MQTASTLAQLMKRLPDIRMKPGRPQTPMVVKVQGGVRYQRILGFGATLTDSSAWLIRRELAPAARDQLMSRVFSSHGINLNYLRLPMGASDFTARGKPYSYDDMAAGRSDPGLKRFSVAHDLPYVIPTLRQALAIHPGVFIIASPWSAPGWMKTNQRSDNFDRTGTLLPVGYRPLAAYFVRFLRAYRRRGVDIAAVTPQNEPVVAADPGMQLSEPDEATFITRYLRPAFAAARLSTQIFGHDLSWDMRTWADALATGPAARYLSGISWHCYYGDPTAMAQLHALAPRLIQLVNECSPEVRPFSTAEALIGSLRNGASGVALWNLALDPVGGPVQPPNTRCPECRGVVTIDEGAHRAYPGPTYYQLGQVSKFVARGAVRIGTNTFVTDGIDTSSFYAPTVGLDDVAFVNPDGEKVLVTYNSSPRPIRFAVRWHRYRLMRREPAGAMTTFTWR